MVGILNTHMFEQKIVEASNCFLDGLVRGGSVLARVALNELSGRALGGNPDAQSLIKEIDMNFASGELILPVQREESVAGVGLVGRIKQFIIELGTVNRLLPPDRDP